MIIPEREIEIAFSRSAGRGGQNVNKVSTKVILHWNIWQSSILTQKQKEKIINRWPNKIDQKGNFIIYSQKERSQYQNRQEAMQKLQNFVALALNPVKKRITTKPPYWTRRRRLTEKKKQAEKKKLRRKII